jgi:membrane protein implicated in regulation of membrane protease activity
MFPVCCLCCACVVLALWCACVACVVLVLLVLCSLKIVSFVVGSTFLIVLTCTSITRDPKSQFCNESVN